MPNVYYKYILIKEIWQTQTFIYHILPSTPITQINTYDFTIFGFNVIYCVHIFS